MNRRVKLLRTLGMAVLVVCIGGVIGGFILLMTSILKPTMEIQGLYRVRKSAQAVSFGFIAFAVITAWLINFLSVRLPQIQKQSKLSNRDLRILQIVAAICVVLAFLSWNALNVQPSSDKWLAVTKAGTWEIPLTVAREYLWRNIMGSSVIILGLGLGLGLMTKNLIRIATSISRECESGGTRTSTG
jgi:hypothetical protein